MKLLAELPLCGHFHGGKWPLKIYVNPAQVVCARGMAVEGQTSVRLVAGPSYVTLLSPQQVIDVLAASERAKAQLAIR